MTTYIPGFGLQVRVKASITNPAGFTISQFGDESDPFDLPTIQVGDAAMDINGNLIAWSKANPIKLAISLTASSNDNKNMMVIFENNRPARGKLPIMDVISISGIYPNGETLSLTGGVIIDGMPGWAVSNQGRLKTMVYNFQFENLSRT